MRPVKKSFAFAFALILAQLFFTESSQAIADNKPILLKGTIEHSERLDPVPPNLMRGNVYAEPAPASAGVAKAVATGNQWFLIPAWFAGTWRSDTATQISKETFRTGQIDSTPSTSAAKVIDTYGYLPDSQGGMWDYDDGSKSDVEQIGNALFYGLYSVYRPVDSTADSVTYLFRRTVLLTNKTDHQIRVNWQDELIVTMKRTADGYQETDSIKTFDQNGDPTGSATVLSNWYKIAPVNTQVNITDKKRVADLRNFLIQNGKSDLVPDYAN